MKFRVYGYGSLTVQTIAQILDLAGNHLVTLLVIVKKHIVNGLDANGLASGRDQRNLPEFFSYPGKLFVNLIDLMQRIHFP